MKKKVKVVMLPTEKGVLSKIKNIPKLIYTPLYGQKKTSRKYQANHLYLVSDEEIKEGDWVIFEHIQFPQKVARHYRDVKKEGGKKIIATTDKSLSEKTCDRCDGNGRYIEKASSTRPQRIMSGYTYCSKCSERGVLSNLPQIPESFIKAYVEANGEIDEVMVEYDNPSPWTEKEIKDWNIKAKLELKTTESNEVIISLPEVKMYTKEEARQLIIDAMVQMSDWKNEGHTTANLNPLMNKWVQENL